MFVCLFLIFYLGNGLFSTQSRNLLRFLFVKVWQRDYRILKADKPKFITPGFKSQAPLILKIKHARVYSSVLTFISLSLVCHQKVSPTFLASLPTSNNLIEKTHHKSAPKLCWCRQLGSQDQRLPASIQASISVHWKYYCSCLSIFRTNQLLKYHLIFRNQLMKEKRTYTP